MQIMKFEITQSKLLTYPDLSVLVETVREYYFLIQHLVQRYILLYATFHRILLSAYYCSITWLFIRDSKHESHRAI